MNKRPFVLVVFLLLAIPFLYGRGNEQEGQEVVSKFLAKSAKPLWECQDFRHIVVTNKDEEVTCSVDASTQLAAGKTFTFEVIRWDGDEHTKGVIEKILTAEKKAWENGQITKSGFVTQNYIFSPEDLGNVWKMSVVPKREDDFLIRGQLLVGADGELLSAEGVLVKNPSWWTPNVKVKRVYRQIGDMTMPARQTVTVRLRIFGVERTMTVTFKYLSVNGVITS